MWIRASDTLSENLNLLTTAVSSHLLVQGSSAALIDTSVTPFADSLIEQIKQNLLEGVSLDYIFFTHAHFDNLGGVVQLRQAFPGLKLIASPGAAELLEKADYLEAAYDFNNGCCEAIPGSLMPTRSDWLGAFNLDRIIGDGDTIELGEAVELKAVSTPGYRREALAYYVRPDNALIGGEAVGGYYGRDRIFGCFADGLEDYRESLNRLSNLQVDIICLPHSGALTGDLARTHLMKLDAEASRFADTVRGRVEQGEIVQEIFASTLAEWRTEGVCPSGPFASIQEETLMAMIESSAKAGASSN